MKNLTHLSLLATLGLLVGCSGDPTTEGALHPPPAPEQENPHAVPVEQALGELQGLLEAIDAPAEDGAATRSGGIRRVKSVTAVPPEMLSPAGTRSEAMADIEELLYIVNFENGDGYAVLGADDRLEPVYAVVDEGSLTAEDFRYAVTVTDEQAQADGKFVFPLQMVAQATLGGIGSGGGSGIIGGPVTDIKHRGPEGQQPVGIDYGPWETKEQSGILLKTKWNQIAPYNYLCPMENGKNCFAGCVPVAVAQILVHNAVEYNEKFYQVGSRPIKNNIWLAIENAVKDPSLIRTADNEPVTAETQAVAYFINVIGEAVGVEYHSGDRGSSAPTKNVVKLLRNLGDTGLGYSNIVLSSITTDKVQDMIFVKKLPFYYSGASSVSRHAWVLDGWVLREREVTVRYAFLPTQCHTESKVFIHANFGWGGEKDGYYTFNAFYTDRELVSPQSIEDRNYDHDFSAVTYNLSK